MVKKHNKAREAMAKCLVITSIVITHTMSHCHQKVVPWKFPALWDYNSQTFIELVSFLESSVRPSKHNLNLCSPDFSIITLLHSPQSKPIKMTYFLQILHALFSFCLHSHCLLFHEFPRPHARHLHQTSFIIIIHGLWEAENSPKWSH